MAHARPALKTQAGTQTPKEMEAVDTRAYPRPTTSRVPEDERVRICRPAVLRRDAGTEREPREAGPEAHIVRGDD
ncbi:hypothetical protein [Streptomyces zhihengii]